MKKKYVKPVMTQLQMPIIQAQGFETLGVCSNGDFVGDSTNGSCNTGTLPDTTDGECNTGSSDSVFGSQCLDGSFANTSCASGTAG